MTIMAFGVAGYGAVAMVLSLSGELPSMVHHFPDRTTAAAVHFGVGGFVLLIGPFQFLPRLRAKRPQIHRWTGRLYVAGCLASGVAALVLATHTITGGIATAGFSLLAIFWIISTSLAFVMALKGKFAEHRRWMIRSYALTLAAVTLRLYLPSSMALDIPFETAYPIISFACWVPNAVFAEWLLRRS